MSSACCSRLSGASGTTGAAPLPRSGERRGSRLSGDAGRSGGEHFVDDDDTGDNGAMVASATASLCAVTVTAATVGCCSNEKRDVDAAASGDNLLTKLGMSCAGESEAPTEAARIERDSSRSGLCLADLARLRCTRAAASAVTSDSGVPAAAAATALSSTDGGALVLNAAAYAESGGADDEAECASPGETGLPPPADGGDANDGRAPRGV